MADETSRRSPAMAGASPHNVPVRDKAARAALDGHAHRWREGEIELSAAREGEDAEDRHQPQGHEAPGKDAEHRQREALGEQQANDLASAGAKRESIAISR